MKTRLIALHGFTQNAAVLRASLEPLLAELGARVDLVCPDGPQHCSDESIERMQRMWGLDRRAPPYLSWWNATDDGRVYRGWDESRAQLAALAAEGPFGVLGFSQGAMVATAIAALAAHGEFPVPKFAILVAGRAPRADDLRARLEQPLPMPSLHVWGERDTMVHAVAQQLVEHFAPEQREVVTWPGPHAIPTRGEAAQAIVRFVERHG
jgi:pimeloyl-ACP methyl ester carboxylesterase